MEDAAIISALISLVMLIVFFVMAANIGRIKNILISQTESGSSGNVAYVEAFNRGEIKEYQGKTQEAIDCYMEAYFLFHKYSKKNPKISGLEKHREMIQVKIKALGGTIKAITE